MICPLCHSKNASQVATADAHWIIQAYRRAYGMNVRSFFQKDKVTKHLCVDCGLGFFENGAEGDEEFYGALQKTKNYYRPGKWEYHAAASLLPAGGCTLDVGCGEGLFSRQVSRGRFVGLELNRTAVESAVAAGVDVRHESTSTHLAKNREAYDCVASFQVLEHVANPRRLLEEMIDLLKPGGMLIIAVPNNDSYLASKPNQLLNLPPHHQLHWNEQSLRSAGRLLGLEVTEVLCEPLDPVHRADYLNYVATLLVRGRKYYSQRLTDGSLLNRVLGRIGGALVNRLAKNGIPDDIFPIGHTILVAYRKPLR